MARTSAAAAGIAAWKVTAMAKQAMAAARTRGDRSASSDQVRGCVNARRVMMGGAPMKTGATRYPRRVSVRRELVGERRTNDVRRRRRCRKAERKDADADQTSLHRSPNKLMRPTVRR